MITIKNDPETTGNRTFEVELTSPLIAVNSTPLLGDIKVTHVTIMDVGKKINYSYRSYYMHIIDYVNCVCRNLKETLIHLSRKTVWSNMDQ